MERKDPVLVCSGGGNEITINWVAYKQQAFISDGSGGWESKIVEPARWDSGEGPLPCCRLLTSLWVFAGQKGLGHSVGSLLILLFIFGCVGSSFLCEGFL